ncbi:DUF190 domain-containing protein [Candidatus Margulisiibacteriota bacterium]
MLKGKGKLLRVFVGEEDKNEGIPLYEWILQKAKADGLAAATVLKGFEGLGDDKEVHTAKIMRLAQDLPIIVEIVDQEEKVLSFTEQIDSVIKNGLATIEDIEIHFYRKG